MSNLKMKELYRIISVLGKVSVRDSKREVIKEYIGDKTYTKLLATALNKNIFDPMTVVYNHLLEKEDYQKIKEFYYLTFGFSPSQLFTILDLFAGDGARLEMFKTAIEIDEISSAKLHLLANESQKDSFNSIQNNELIEESFNETVESLEQLMEGSISLMLYNPPVSKINVKQDLETIINKKILYNSKGDSFYDNNGKIIMILPKKELLKNATLITKYFSVSHDLVYKVNKDDYKKNKQFVVYASLKSNPEDNKEDSKLFKSIINKEIDFSVDQYKAEKLDIPEILYEEMQRNIEIVEESSFEKSNLNNDNWNWMREITEIKDMREEKIKKPTPVKTGELANIIASGMVNGDMELEDGTAKHIVAGGMKQKVQEEDVVEETGKGKEQLVRKKLVYSEPYLNILISENGKARIKELTG